MPHVLKRLELNGFKSFAGKTVLEFPSGITAIVGPNGSGKSNIVDAIRWLLGEREAKHLRGGKVEDLVFAGTPKRPRVGQAQASLHFENSHKLFPVDFSEVTVAREVRRDGTSRYFLNKAEILLRDLIDFFAKARLGSRGFSVVTQGNSDIFIRVSPKERREMIEEILGLREYQLKKQDAERRLRNSEINLEKAKALIEEILPHLRSLKRQTGRWEKRGTLEEELKGLENQFFGYRLRDVERERAALEKELGVEKERLEVLREKKRLAEAHEKEVEAAQPKEREELREIKAKTQAILEERSRLQKELGRLEAQLEMHERAPAAESPHAEELLSFIRKIKSRLEVSAEKGGEELRSAVREILREIDEAIEGKKRGAEVPHDLKTQFEKIGKEVAALGEELTALREKERELEKGQEQFYRAFKEAVGAVQAAGDEIERWERVNQERVLQKERLEMRREELWHQIVQAGRRVEEFAQVALEAGIASEDFDAMERRIFKLRGDLASIGEVDEALLKEAQETESRYEFLSREGGDLEKARDDLRSLIGELNEKIRTEFSGALVAINEEFNKFFTVMFGGGHAKLKIVKPEPLLPKTEEGGGEDVEAGEGEGGKGEAAAEVGEEEETEEGIEIDLKLPRKKLTSLEVLSGGERSLVGIAALFALISVSPPPFLVLDEIDAALDDRNARRFAEMLKEFSKETQFVVVTHNRATMEAAHVLYGVTLGDDGTSKVLSLKLAQAAEVGAKKARREVHEEKKE